MNSPGEQASFTCSGHCHDCGMLDVAQAAQASVPWKGGAFALAAVGTFLPPIACAIAAALLLEPYPGLQAVGALAGLAAGTLVARVLLRLVPSSGGSSACPSR